MLLYVDNGRLSSLCTEWIQEYLEVLTRLFNRVILIINVENPVGIIFRPCRMDLLKSEAAYRRRMTVEVLSCWSHQRYRVCCPDCSAYLSAGSLAAHLQSQHMIVQGLQWENSPPLADPQLYQVPFTKTVGLV